MADLQLGDFVLTRSGRYREVILFSHRDAKIRASFIAISTTSNRTVHLTPGHYIYANGVLKQARDVMPGDALETSVGEKTTATIIHTMTMLGLYNPHTYDDSIVVNGVRASTYTSAISPILAHALLWPVRVMQALGIDTRWLDFNQGLGSIAWVLGA